MHYHYYIIYFVLDSSTYVLNACCGFLLYSFLLSSDFMTYSVVHIARLYASVACTLAAANDLNNI